MLLQVSLVNQQNCFHCFLKSGIAQQTLYLIFSISESYQNIDHISVKLLMLCYAGVEGITVILCLIKQNVPTFAIQSD